jgi:phosphoglycolate phosphatase-like HAD superfamily hydrolase
VIQFNRNFNPEKMRLLSFDLDGTLIDSRQDVIHSVNATLRYFECLELPAELFAAFVGGDLSMLLRRALGDPDVSLLAPRVVSRKPADASRPG